MTFSGHVHNGVIVPDVPTQLPEGAEVRIELLPSKEASASPRRRGGQWRGQVRIAEDFDELPSDLAEAFGAAQS